jgi:hypothetical protein
MASQPSSTPTIGRKARLNNLKRKNKRKYEKIDIDWGLVERTTGEGLEEENVGKFLRVPAQSRTRWSTMMWTKWGPPRLRRLLLIATLPETMVNVNINNLRGTNLLPGSGRPGRGRITSFFRPKAMMEGDKEQRQLKMEEDAAFTTCSACATQVALQKWRANIVCHYKPYKHALT